MNSTLTKLKMLINQSEAIVIGAGAGLSASAGFEYGGETFMKNFKWMHDKYGYQDLYSASFHDFDDPLEKWAFFSKFVYLNRFVSEAKPLYKELYEIFKNKNYFVITTNVDHEFQLAGFNKERLFYTQGDYGLFQCSVPCHDKTYDNKEVILKMVNSIKNNKIDPSLIPYCPKCHKEMTINLRKDNHFVEDEGWFNAQVRYLKFLSENKNKNTLFLEIGVGYNTPVIIKYPFMRMTYDFKKAIYVSINKETQYIPKEIEDKSIPINSDINKVFSNLKSLI